MTFALPLVLLNRGWRLEVEIRLGKEDAKRVLWKPKFSSFCFKLQVLNLAQSRSVAIQERGAQSDANTRDSLTLVFQLT